MNKKIDTILFDCFGVVCSEVLNGWYKEHRLKNGLVDENLPSILRKCDLGLMSEDDIVDYFLSYSGVDSTKEKMRQEIDSCLKLDIQLVAIIKKLREKGFKIGLLSNANAAFFERKVYPTYPEFKSLFDEIVISSSVNMVKPDKEIYFYTLDKLGSKPEQSIFVDDSKTNVDAANSFGITGFLYTTPDSFLGYLTNIGIEI